MSIQVHQLLTDAIGDWISGHAKKSQPSLSYEIESVNTKRFMDFIVNSINDWNADIFFVLTLVNNKRCLELVSLTNIGNAIIAKLENDITTAVLNPATGDGITIDCDQFNQNEITDLTLIASGEHEDIAQKVAILFPEGCLFRGN